MRGKAAHVNAKEIEYMHLLTADRNKVYLIIVGLPL
jgi:hypothetical protein